MRIEDDRTNLMFQNNLVLRYTAKQGYKTYIKLCFPLCLCFCSIFFFSSFTFSWFFAQFYAVILLNHGYNPAWWHTDTLARSCFYLSRSLLLGTFTVVILLLFCLCMCLCRLSLWFRNDVTWWFMMTHSLPLLLVRLPFDTKFYSVFLCVLLLTFHTVLFRLSS